MSYIATDPIADMLTRIRNAIAVGKTKVLVPHSKLKEGVAKILKENNYIDGYEVDKLTIGKNLNITINGEHQNARITEIVRLSRPGRRSYANVKFIPTVKQGRGLVIVSTSSGLMTGNQAKAKNIGGELICRVY
ncbi:MAG: 30S ribosomal protein S8 [Candidatus Saccharimonadales bacterium]